MTKNTQETTNSKTVEQLVIKISTTGRKVKSSDAQSEGSYPVIDQGEELISGYVNDASKLLGVLGQTIVFGDHSRRIKLVNHDFVPGADGIVVLQPIEEISAELLVYLMEYQLLTMRDNGYARHWQHLKKAVVQFPKCKSAQAQIVSLISEASLQIDHGLSSLEKAERQLELYRQSVLKDAFEGKLTADWRIANPDLVEPADKLLDRIEAERKAAHQAELDAWEDAVNQWETNGKEGKKPIKPKFTKSYKSIDLAFNSQVELPQPWSQCLLGNLMIKPAKNGIYKPQSAYSDEGTPIIRIDNLKPSKIDQLDKLKRVNLDKDELHDFQLEEGDLVLNRVNSIDHIGKSAFVNQISSYLVYESNLMKFHPSEKFIDRKYLTTYLNSSAGLKELRKNAKHAVNQASINQDDVANALVILPGYEEQVEIGKKFNQLDLSLELIQQQIIDEVQRALALKQSILKQAFSGYVL